MKTEGNPEPFATESSTSFPKQETKEKVQLQKGPAYDQLARPEHQNTKPNAFISDWPMYRRDTTRSGYASTQVKAEAREAWTTDIGNRITPPIAAGGAVFVASGDGRLGGMMWAVSAQDGRKLSEQKLNSLPVFDGLIAADEKLFMSTTDGRVICYR